MKKKLVTVILSAVLLVGIFPSAAYSQTNTPLQSGYFARQSASLSAQSIKPKTSKAASRSLYKLYRPMLKKAANAEGSFKEYKSVLNSGYDAKYSLYDINSDGTPELVIFAGFYGAGGQNCYVYTVKNGNLKYCGMTNAGFGGVSGGPKCLYIAQAHQGFVGYWTVKLNGTKLVRKTAFEGTDTDADGSLRAFLNKARVNALTWSQCTSYSLLMNKAKLASGKLFDAVVTVQQRAAYTGKAVKPKVTVKYLGTALKAGKDYAVSYKTAQGKKVSAPKAIGTYKVMVEGKGGYKGSVTKAFKVLRGSSPQSLQAQSSKASKNEKAHAAYKKKLWQLRKSQGTTNPPMSAFVDLTGDGVDEMVVAWWPSVYTYRNGKAVRVEKGYIGSDDIYRVYKKAKLIVKSRGDAIGGKGSTYKKWNGKKFEMVATLYTPSSYGTNNPSYWTKADGYTTKTKAKSYVKKLIGTAKASKIKYRKNW